MSSFNGLELFSSGPHRFIIGPVAEQLLERTRVSTSFAGTQPVGRVDETVIIRGRLVADNDENLIALRNDIAALITDPPTSGELIDSAGGSLGDMAIISFITPDPVDRGRTVSLAYEARFIRFLNWP